MVRANRLLGRDGAAGAGELIVGRPLEMDEGRLLREAAEARADNRVEDAVRLLEEAAGQGPAPAPGVRRTTVDVIAPAAATDSSHASAHPKVLFALGKAVFVDPINPVLKATGTILLKLRCDGPVSNVAFKFNLRCHNWVRRARRLGAGAAPLTLTPLPARWNLAPTYASAPCPPLASGTPTSATSPSPPKNSRRPASSIRVTSS
jgi:hypothetical protein